MKMPKLKILNGHILTKMKDYSLSQFPFATYWDKKGNECYAISDQFGYETGETEEKAVVKFYESFSILSARGIIDEEAPAKSLALTPLN